MNTAIQAPPEEGSRFEEMIDAALPSRDHRRYECFREVALLGVESGQIVFDLISDYCAQHMRVLDMGCGNGGVAVAGALRGHRVTAVDIDVGSVARTLARAEAWGVHVDALQGDASFLGLPDESFDLVVMNDIIEHVEDPDSAVDEARRVLRPGGLAYIHAPQRWSPVSIVRDPHYGLTGVSAMPRPIARWYVCKVRRVSQTYDMTVLPSTWGLRAMISRHGLIPVCHTDRYLARKAFASAYSGRRGARVLRVLAGHPVALKLLCPLMPSVLFLAFKPAGDPRAGAVCRASRAPTET